MASQEDENALLSERILLYLSKTRYACSSLTALSGGSVNFLFRGSLSQSIQSQEDDRLGRSTIIVKHGTEFLSVNRNFPLDVSRCISEESMLNALSEVTLTPESVLVPRLYLFDRDTNTQVLEDFPNAIDFKSLLVSPDAVSSLSLPVATSIGYALGVWLKSFHRWSSAPSQRRLRAEIAGNEPMRQLKYATSYESLVKILENFPQVLEGRRPALEAVKDMAADEFKRPAIDGDDDSWGLIHGDFWAGNVLVPSAKLLAGGTAGKQAMELVVIDWEYAQFGHRAYDLGQMVGDLYERKHFNDAEAAMWTIKGLVDGYGGLSDEMAFRTAIHAGVQLLHWYNRRDPSTPLTGTPRQIADAVAVGTDFVVKGWSRDRTWFEGSVLAPLFVKR